ncbi:hypothetical protein UPYG_G00308470 [Umbra pygmaea]|uniref:Ig-like domain-containing protein n=1 Tax=Umbra pygmaea TaxID=75934 RepID=A0ABD0VZ55_UMBPY
MASFGENIFLCLIVSIFVTSGLIIFILSVSISVKTSQKTVDSNDKHPIGNLGEDAVLSCNYLTSTTQMVLASRVSITWEKEGLSEVVYQYDKGTVQLTGQSPRFKDRTQLFLDAIGKGNASLLVRTVRLSDEGVYYCSVSAPSGTGTAVVNFRVAAYSAPTFQLTNSTLTASALKWFPKPSVSWLDANGNIVNTSDTEFFSNSIGINQLMSSLQPIKRFEIYTCIIQNQLVKAVSTATVTDNSISSRTFFSFTTSAASPILQIRWHFLASTASFSVFVYQLT